MSHANESDGKWIVSPAAMPARQRPWRKVHLDFHNSRHVASVGEAFDPNEFADTLSSAAIDAIVVFAKDMHGFCYYPSKIGPMHPGLRRDLLAEQVASCQKASIEVYAYYCTLWDHFLADTHPEWLSLKRDGKPYLPEEGSPPDWTALCASNRDLVDLIKGHVREILADYSVDGIWFDMPIPRDGECFCENCVRELRHRSLDPFNAAHQRRYQQELHIAFLRELYETAQAERPGCQVDFNNQPAFGLGDRIAWMDSIDIEALPTAQWGYDFFPVAARYVRTFPRAMYGMTGRFLRGWGDFGGLKSSHQLAAEAFGIVSLGARCDIGDQMPPSGRLDPAVYLAIGAAYREIEAIEPALQGACSIAEAAIVVEGLPLDSVATPSVSGLVKMLAELSIQFDVVEARNDWERYGLVVIEGKALDSVLPARLGRFLERGGKAVLCGAGLIAACADSLGLDDFAQSQFEPAYAVVESGSTAYEFAIYGKSCSWRADDLDTVATEGVPAFQRSGLNFTSHAQTPFQRTTSKSNVSTSSQIGLVGFEVGRLYLETGYWIYRDLVARIFRQLLPRPIVQTEFPGTIQATVSARAAEHAYLVHVLDSTVGRPSQGHPPAYEPGPPRKDVRLTLNLNRRVESVHAVRSNLALDFEARETEVNVTIPTLDRYELLCIRTAPS